MWTGGVVGAWRPQRKGKKLRLTVLGFGQLGTAVCEEIEAEAVAIAPFREADTVQVTFGDAL